MTTPVLAIENTKPQLYNELRFLSQVLPFESVERHLIAGRRSELIDIVLLVGASGLVWGDWSRTRADFQ